MALPTLTGPLDLFGLLVFYVFGSFWFAVISLAILMFIIMGWLGKISIYSCTWYIIFFLLAMTLGYGYVLLNILVTMAVLIAFFFSWKSYLDSR